MIFKVVVAALLYLQIKGLINWAFATCIFFFRQEAFTVAGEELHLKKLALLHKSSLVKCKQSPQNRQTLVITSKNTPDA